MNLAPVVLFVYKRPAHTLKTLQSLQKNKLSEQSHLYIFADAPATNDPKIRESVQQVRQIIRQTLWCQQVSIIERKENFGLAKNILQGVSEIIQKHGKAIILEDDIVTSEGFLTYMNQALTLYEAVPEVMHISGYFFPVSTQNISQNTFFFNQASCWGWGTWASAWQKLQTNAHQLLKQVQLSGRMTTFNADNSYSFSNQLEANISGQMHTWAIKWHTSVFLENGLCLHPKKSLTRNIGFDNTGEHCVYSEIYLNQEITDYIPVEKIPLVESKEVRQKIALFNKSAPLSLITRLKNKFKSFIDSWKK